MNHQKYVILSAAIFTLFALSSAKADSLLKLNSDQGMAIQISYEKGSDGEGHNPSVNVKDVMIKVEAPFLNQSSKVTAVLVVNCTSTSGVVQNPMTTSVQLRSLVEADGSTSFENGLSPEILISQPDSEDEEGKNCLSQLAIDVDGDNGKWQIDHVNKTHNFNLGF
jgi:hypothetical protein